MDVVVLLSSDVSLGSVAWLVVGIDGFWKTPLRRAQEKVLGQPQQTLLRTRIITAKYWGSYYLFSFRYLLF